MLKIVISSKINTVWQNIPNTNDSVTHRCQCCQYLTPSLSPIRHRRRHRTVVACQANNTNMRVYKLIVPPEFKMN